MGDFFRGAATFVRAIGFAWSRARLRNLILIPTLLVAIATIFGARPLYHVLNQLAHDRLHVHGGALGALLSVAIFLVAAVLLYLAFLLGSSLVLAPLGGVLADRTDEELHGKSDTSTPLATMVKEALRGVAHTLLVTGIFVMTLVPLVVLNWLLPLLAPLVAVQAALFLAYDGLDPMLSRDGRGLAAKWAFLRAHLGYCLGFGLAGAAFFAIPVVNLFAPPVVAIGGTLLYFQITETKPA